MTGTTLSELRVAQALHLVKEYKNTPVSFRKITVLGARPKMGKSTLALNEAIYSSITREVPTLIFSLEMDKEELLEKAGSDIAEIDNKKLKRGELSEEQIDKFIRNGPETCKVLKPRNENS